LNNNPILLTTQYLPSILYLSLFTLGRPIHIESFENYQKGSLRNRAHLLGSNGEEVLSVPLAKGKHQQTPIREVCIHPSQWRKQHLGMIQSAYGRSPFFEYYFEDLKSILDNAPPLLMELNQKILEFLLKSFGISASYSWTQNYQYSYEVGLDGRIFFSTQKTRFLPTGLSYEQVFTYKFGFTPGLSSLDLLFCQGPYGLSLLKATAKETILSL
jgi:hypothetical protein